jgi:ABC-type transport system substrate-binding protein
MLLVAAALTFAAAGEAAAQAAPAGEVVVAFHVTIAPSWFDPSSAPPQVTPFGILYALHDAVIRPLPGKRIAPSLAESWTESPDGKTYEFKLRRGLKFHNGDPLTTEDVKFSFERYKGAGAKELQTRVRQHASIFWIEFPEQWDPKSPWHDKRLRQAVNYALNRQAINEAACLGFCPPAGVIVPRVMDFADHALNTIHLHPYPSWEDMKLKNP